MKRYWFVRKFFGFGASPVTWEGAAAMAGATVLLISVMIYLPRLWSDARDGEIADAFAAAVLIGLFAWLFVGKTDPRPWWRNDRRRAR